MASGDIYELTVDQTYGGQDIVNVHHFVQIGDDGSGDARDALTKMWDDDFKTPFLAVVVDVLNVVQVKARRLFPTQTQQFFLAVGETGTQVQTGLPPQQCAILAQVGTRFGNRGRGYMKISGVPITEVDSGRITAAYATLLNTLGTEHSTNHTASPSGYVFHGAVLSSVDDVARQIQKAGGTSRIKTVYSRSIGVGS